MSTILVPSSGAAPAAGRRPLPLSILLLLSILPALTTWSAFYLEVWPYIIYPLAKISLLFLPFAVWRLAGHRWLAGLPDMGLGPPSRRGVVSGLLLSVLIVGAFFLLAAHLDGSAIRQKLESLAILDFYWTAAFFILAVNSALEEWYWRGFLLAEWRNHVKQPAVVIAGGGLFFGFHHFFTLLPYFPLALALLFTGATMLAGALWSRQRLQGWSLLDCYLSHLVADLTIIMVGAILVFSA